MGVLLFEKHFTLTNGMFDEHYGMKPYAYLDIFQRIAGDHADLLGIGNEYCEKHGYAWIVVRQELYMYDLINKDRLNLVSEAKLYSNIIKYKNVSQSELAKRLGKSRSSISNSLRILTLDKSVLNLVNKYKLTLGQVKPLIGLDTEIIIKLISRINSEKLSSREIEVIARGEKNKNKKIIILNETERMINQRYSCKSRVRGNKIELTFRNKKELEVFINSLK